MKVGVFNKEYDRQFFGMFTAQYGHKLVFFDLFFEDLSNAVIQDGVFQWLITFVRIGFRYIAPLNPRAQ